MSLLLLLEEEWISIMDPYRKNVQKANDQIDNQFDFLSKVDESAIRELRKQKMFNQSTCHQDVQNKRYLVLFKNPKFQTQGVLAFNFDKREGGNTITMDLLSVNGLPLKLENKFQAIEICKKLAFSQEYGALLAKFSVGMINRRVKMAIPYFTHYLYNIFENSSQKQKQGIILIIGKSFLHTYLPFLQSVLSSLVPHQNQKELIQLKAKKELCTQKKEILNKIYRYSQMLVVESQFIESSLETQKEINQKQRKIQESINALSINALEIPPQLMKSLSLMVLTLNEQYRLNRFILSVHELNMIKNIIAMPFQPKSKNPYQNTMVLNHILINQQTSTQLMKINDGGFSSIHFGQFKFWYVQSSEGYEYYLKKENLSPKKLMSKCLAVKNVTQRNKQNQILSKIEHQTSVLKNIKNGSSIFLPKYYIPINQTTLYQNSVLMDFIPFYNLSTFLATTTLSLSLLSKLYIIFSLIQSLRYIREYKIVHLDLKPNNVMMFCNMLIKLIDFGESYHPSVSPISYKPAFSLPYASPQLFQENPNFTSKSDVFSLGIIMYQMLYERYPFNITKLNANLRQQMKQYFKYWYFPPQEYQNYGDMVVLRVLNNVISKCLSLNPRQRPQLDWIAVVIRYCFDLIC